MHKLIEERLTSQDVGLEDQILVVDLNPNIAERHTIKMNQAFTPVTGPFSICVWKERLYAIVILYDEDSQQSLDNDEKLIPVTLKLACTDDPDQVMRTITFKFNRFGTGRNKNTSRSLNVLDMMPYLERAIFDKQEEIFDAKDGETVTWETYFIWS